MFTIFEQDSKQRTRFLHSLNAPAIAIGHTLICWLCYEVGLFRMEMDELVALFVIFWAGHLAFIACILAGINRYFPDPSLVLPQMIWATLTVLITAYYVDQMRASVMMMFLAIMTIGAFELKLRGFLFVAVFGVSGFACVLYLLSVFEPQTIMVAAQLLQEFLQFGALTLVAVIFVLVGTSISRLRQQLAQKNEELSEAFNRIHDMAIRDELTGLFNRRYIMDVLRRQKLLADRERNAFSFCFVDLDHFKSINDNFGHGAGDEVLKVSAKLMQSCIRSVDYCARYGGEEFVIILVHANLSEAMAVSERIRTCFETYDYSAIENGLSMTTSIGVTVYGLDESLDQTIARADEMVYKAKESGRNCVKSAPPPLNIASINRIG